MKVIKTSQFEDYKNKQYTYDLVLLPLSHEPENTGTKVLFTTVADSDEEAEQHLERSIRLNIIPLDKGDRIKYYISNGLAKWNKNLRPIVKEDTEF